MEYVTLNNGLTMPQLGFGVWQVGEDEVVPAVKKALETGYRSIDTAAAYKNEEGVGQAITESGIPREELFITTKVWNGDQGYDNTLRAFETSMEKLGLDYLDLYLIHWPTPEFDDYVDTYKAMEKLYNDGKIKAIGVCNFEEEHLQRLMDECDVKPAVNQVECHPYFAQTKMKKFCRDHNIYVEAWSPLMQGKTVLEDEAVRNLAEKHGKTPAQVVLRWHLQNQSIVIPKSVTPSRIEENFNVFDFELEEEDIKQVDKLDCGDRQGPVPSEMNKR
ncbi:aldo/keto reductase [Salibacterium aidingense]|uniref:aldo/keto reductase n=1 Tax=Salibacterium aidingense TaxID=384933 RepID=UPI003BE0D756